MSSLSRIADQKPDLAIIEFRPAVTITAPDSKKIDKKRSVDTSNVDIFDWLSSH